MIHSKRSRLQGPVKAACAGIFAITVSSCGGGGGGGAPAQEDAAPPADVAARTSMPATNSNVPGYLVLSEVATNYYSNDIAWLEVHNPGTTPAALSGYALRSSSIDPVNGATSFAPITFSLPAVEVPAKGHLVIAGKTSDRLKDNSQMVYVRNGASVPFWNANGSVELVSDGATADFVRFGTSTAAPLSATAWRSGNVAALPSAADEHGKSIVRLASGGMADTHTAADWSLVNFATPAGRNDVPPGVVDSDLDGIPDSAKVSGGTYGGLDLYAMGARRGRRDIFVELDYMTGADPAMTPRLEALQKIEASFAVRGIALHIDAGNLHAAAFDPARFNLDGGNPVAHATCIDLDSVGSGARDGCASFMSYKSAHFDVRRKLVFHYALFANSLNLNGGAGSSGIAEMNGNDLIVTLGGYGLSTTPGSGLNMLINLQASTLMHELGHNLGLRHGGNENANYKPNHYSIMNYLYQFTGLSTTPDSVHAAERYYLANGLKGKTFCGLTENSPCGDSFVMSYSDGGGAALDENALAEAGNIGRGAAAGAYADWDDNNAVTGGLISRNINPLDGASKGVLRDFNEWANLKLPFARSFSGSNSGNGLATRASTRHGEDAHEHRNARKRERVLEEPLPPHLQSMIRSLPRRAH